MAQSVKALAAKTEDPSSVPKIRGEKKELTLVGYSIISTH